MALEDIRSDRVRKLARYAARGHDPYPASVRRNFLISKVVQRFTLLARGKKKVSVVGRLMAWREHGGVTFADLADASGAIQLAFHKSELGEEYALALQAVDIGDFLEITGTAFKTQRGEATLRVSVWRLIAKSLRPLPEKWHGLKDVEGRFRKRYLDLLMDPEVRERFLTRSRVIRALREFFDRGGFLEVETPMLQHLPGGALAKPFRTHYNALNIDLFLRIAPELYLKELLVGGLEKVYELGKSFRNEGIDVTHNPEFTTIEWYAAYWDEEDMMSCVEKCFLHILKRVGVKNGKISFGGKAISFGKKFPRISFKDVLQRYALIADYDAETADSLRTAARRYGIEAPAHTSKGKIADEIFKKICRPHLVQPTFVVHHPIEISPLAKRAAAGSQTVRRLQLVVGGAELVNGYAELNDPADQKQRFEAQQKMQSGGEEEAHPFDAGFIEALEYGMPPAAGCGMGIDRLVILLTDTRNIREVVLFPTLRPK